MGLPDGCGAHEQRQQIEGEVDARNVPDRVRPREVGDPEEALVSQFDGAQEHRVEAEEDGELHEHREAAAEGADPVGLIQVQHLRVELLGLVLVLLLDFLQLGLERLHLLHGAVGLGLEGPEDRADDHDHQDDGEAVAVGHFVQGIHQVEEDHADPAEHAEIHDPALFFAETLKPPVLARTGVIRESNGGGGSGIQADRRDAAERQHPDRLRRLTGTKPRQIHLL
ncbi:MAG: hypothetical protein BWY77_01976 [bacterium ADurb.Bin431]|nr:MAG: hypothetical protein BWY77_01976 [bacterium ADurb.Bin431]